MIPILVSAVSLFKNNKTTVISILVSLILFWTQVNTCNHNSVLEKKLAVAEHNVQVASDTIRYERTRAGDTLAVKLAYLTTTITELKKLNADLAGEVKNIKGNVSTIIKGEVRLVHDTVPLIVKGELVDSNLTTTFDYSKVYSPGNSRVLKGYTKYNLRNGQTGGELTNDELSMRFTTGIKNLDKGKPEIFIESKYPGFSVTSLDGAVLDPKLFQPKNRVRLITTGVNIGWTPVTYDVGTQKLDFNFKRFGVTAGINVNILKLLKKQ